MNTEDRHGTPPHAIVNLALMGLTYLAADDATKDDMLLHLRDEFRALVADSYTLAGTFLTDDQIEQAARVMVLDTMEDAVLLAHTLAA